MLPDAGVVEREPAVPARPLPEFRVGDVVVHHADEADIPAIVALNNLYAPDGVRPSGA